MRRVRHVAPALVFYHRCREYAESREPDIHVAFDKNSVWHIGLADLYRKWFGSDYDNMDRYHYVLKFDDGRSIRVEHDITGDIHWPRGTRPTDEDLAEARLIL
jgi:hypothetical protein